MVFGRKTFWQPLRRCFGPVIMLGMCSPLDCGRVLPLQSTSDHSQPRALTRNPVSMRSGPGPLLNSSDRQQGVSSSSLKIRVPFIFFSSDVSTVWGISPGNETCVIRARILILASLIPLKVPKLQIAKASGQSIFRVALDDPPTVLLFITGLRFLRPANMVAENVRSDSSVYVTPQVSRKSRTIFGRLRGCHWLSCPSRIFRKLGTERSTASAIVVRPAAEIAEQEPGHSGSDADQPAFRGALQQRQAAFPRRAQSAPQCEQHSSRCRRRLFSLRRRPLRSN